jgi:hypothetical protein
MGQISAFRVALGVYLGYALWLTLIRNWKPVTNPWAVKLVLAVSALIIPTLIDMGFGIRSAGLATPIYAHWFNLLFALLFALTVDRADVIPYLKWYCYFSVIEAIIGLYAYFTLEFPLAFIVQVYGSDFVSQLDMIHVEGDLTRLNGTFFDPNFYGFYLVSVIAISQWLYFYSEKKPRYLAFAGLALGQLILTSSRTALLGLLGVLVAIAVVRRLGLRVLVITCIIALLGSIPLLLDASLGARFINPGTAFERLAFFQRGLNAFLGNPIVGGGSEALVDPESGISTAHSVYISVLGRNGLLGLSCYCVALILVLHQVILSRKIERSRKEFVLQILLMLAMIFVSYDIWYFFEPLYVWLAFALVFARPHAVNHELVPYAKTSV